MDLEEQATIKRVVEEHGKKDELVVILGSPDAESAEIYAETMITGDPSYAGALAGVPLGLPVYHILEPEIKAQIDQQVYQQQVGIMETVLDAAKIAESVSDIRRNTSPSS